MITLIFSAFFVILGGIIVTVIAAVGSPAFLAEFGSMYGEFMHYISFGYRYLYFLFGDFTRPFLDAVLFFLELKYLVLPIISVVRSVIAHGG